MEKERKNGENQSTKILIINPGSTSTKIAVYENTTFICGKNLSHSTEELGAFPTVIDQLDFRFDAVDLFLKKNNIAVEDISLIMARGGCLKPLASGVYRVCEKMLNDLINAPMSHASNLGALIGNKFATQVPNLTCLIADPVVVDEMTRIAQYSGHPNFQRKSIFHALNQKFTARKMAEELKVQYRKLVLIGVHLGGGISVALHYKGLVVDVNNALNGDGPFSPERAGTQPVGQHLDKAYRPNPTPCEHFKMLKGNGGLNAYLGTNDYREAKERIDNGDIKAHEVVEAMIYQIAKEIASLSVFTNGEIDGIFLTGGMAHCAHLTSRIITRVRFLSKTIKVYSGEGEMEALLENGLMALSGEKLIQDY